MLILTFFISGTGFPIWIKKLSGKITIPLFGLSGNCTEAILTGITGGYNCAVKSAQQLYENDTVTAEEAKRIILFFTNPGLSFSINVCGKALYSSTDAGIILFIISAVTSIITASLYNFFNKNTYFREISQSNNNPSQVFVSSVSGAVSAIITISSWITVFSVFSELIRVLLPVKIINTFIAVFGEITSAVMFSAKNCSLNITSFCLSFGGLCIFLQQLPCLLSIGISPYSYLAYRLLQGAISALLSRVFFKLFPVTVDVFNKTLKFEAYSSSFTGAFSLMLLGAVLIYSVKNTKLSIEKTKTELYQH